MNCNRSTFRMTSIDLSSSHPNEGHDNEEQQQISAAAKTLVEMQLYPRCLEAAEGLAQLSEKTAAAAASERSASHNQAGFFFSRSRRTSGSTRYNQSVSNSSEESGSRSSEPASISPVGRASRPTKTLSVEARLNRAWCNNIKLIDIKSVPVFFPEKQAFCGELPERISLKDDVYDPERADAAQCDPNHAYLSVQEQRMIASFRTMEAERYIQLKTRIFACFHWRLEDGRRPNLESAQQACCIDVKVTSYLARWYISMNLFPEEAPQYKAIVADRPAGLGRLRRPGEDETTSSHDLGN